MTLRAAVALLALVAAFKLGRSFRVDPPEPAFGLDEMEPDEDAGQFVPMAAWAPPSWAYARDGVLGDFPMWSKTTTTTRKD